MTDATPSLTERIETAIGEHLAANGGGLTTAFVVAADTVAAEGHHVLYILSPVEQATYASLGLATYLQAWFTDDAQRSWTGTVEDEGHGDYEGDD